MLTPHEALDILRNHCQYSKGEDHIQAVFEAIWQQPTILSQPPTTTLVSLNPILREATNMFQKKLRVLSRCSMQYESKIRPGWLLEVISCGHAPAAFLQLILNDELSRKENARVEVLEAILSEVSRRSLKPLPEQTRREILAALARRGGNENF